MITAVEPIIKKDGRYSIGEAAKLLEVHRNTLRKYMDEGFIKFGYRRHNGRRFITGSELIKFWKTYI